MRTWLINQWDSFRTGFWFIPSLLIAAAVVLAVIVPQLDIRFADSTPKWIMMTGSTARSTLSALASAMFTVAGVVFSATVVTLSLTSSQFGPRLMRSFLEHSITQFTMGGCLACGIYCTILLWRIDNANGRWFVPHIAVFLATLMSIAAILAVVAFIHRVANSVQPMKLVADVAADLDAAIARQFPEKILDTPTNRAASGALDTRFEGKPTTPVLAPADGYLQAINSELLLSMAREHDFVIKLDCRPGGFLIKGQEIAQCLPDVACDGATAKRMSAGFLVGNRRTPRQDVECAVDELVEVAVRALSPGLNDPFTAVASVDRLSASFCRLALRDSSVSIRFDGDDEEQARIIAVPIPFDGILRAGFDQIRQYGTSSVAVSIRLLESLERIAKVAVRNADLLAIKRQAEMIVEGCNSKTFCTGDEEDIRERFNRVVIACSMEASSERRAAGNRTLVGQG